MRRDVYQVPRTSKPTSEGDLISAKRRSQCQVQVANRAMGSSAVFRPSDQVQSMVPVIVAYNITEKFPCIVRDNTHH